MAQLAEQLICNQQVIGSIPIVGSMDGFPSGQRGQTVNLLAQPSKVRILLPPPSFDESDGTDEFRTCGHRIMAITLAFQANDAGSIPAARSKR